MLYYDVTQWDMFQLFLRVSRDIVDKTAVIIEHLKNFVTDVAQKVPKSPKLI